MRIILYFSKPFSTEFCSKPPPSSVFDVLIIRALKTKGNTPKYGLIFHASAIGRATPKNKGRISRYLANKCSIASRIDCFSENATAKFGELLRYFDVTFAFL